MSKSRKIKDHDKELASSLGLSVQLLTSLIRTLESNPNIKKAKIYGSRAKGNYKPGSDIDISLFGESLTLTNQLDIDNKLDDLLLPYQFDISLFNQIDNKEQQEHIQRVGITLYNK